MKHWKEYLTQVTTSGWEAPSLDIISNLLSRQAIEHGLTFQEGSIGDKCTIPVEELYQKIVDLKGVLIRKSEPSKLSNKLSTFIWDDAVFNFNYSPNSDQTWVSWASNNPLLSLIFSALESFLTKREPKGHVFVLIPCTGGLRSESIGVGAVPLLKDNYNKDTIEGYEAVVNDIKSKNPLGRLAIFDGPPGTGKTFLIRALLSDLPKVKFLLLPSNMMESLTAPELLLALMNESDSDSGCGDQCSDTTTKPVAPKPFGYSNDNKDEKTPLVLIVEDADRCLSHRATDNISAISSLLNISEGIIGNLLDIRIICTTNAEIDDIDGAIMRTGRLSARVEVGLLSVEKAKEVYARIGGTESQEWDKKFYALSDVYAMVKGLKSNCVVGISAITKKAKVGFCAPTNGR